MPLQKTSRSGLTETRDWWRRRRWNVPLLAPSFLCLSEPVFWSFLCFSVFTLLLLLLLLLLLYLFRDRFLLICVKCSCFLRHFFLYANPLYQTHLHTFTQLTLYSFLGAHSDRTLCRNSCSPVTILYSKTFRQTYSWLRQLTEDDNNMPAVQSVTCKICSAE